MLRKTRESLTESALVTFETHVLPPQHPAVLAGGQRRLRQAYQYSNGSVIVVGGLDKPGKVMSTEYDLIYVQEAIEVEEEAWEALTTRLRNGVLPYQQLLADTNPDRPTHWLKKRCDTGKTLLLESRHEDNPRLWDAKAGQWTADGTSYLAKLDNLTGPRKQRLRYGKWVQAEGVVYPEWNAAVHIIDRFEIPKHWPRFWTVDFGFTNPLVIQWWAQDGDGRVYLYRELYQSQLLVEDAAREALALSANEPRPRAIICDHDAEGRATLERHLGINTLPATKDVSSGIQAVATRLRPAGDGKPRLFVLRDSLVRRDPRMEEQKKPCGLIEEIDGYIWNTSANRKQGEEPVKENDHSCDAARYLVMEVDKTPILTDFIQLKLRPDVSMPEPPPSSLRWPQHMRWFAQTKKWQPWVVTRDNVQVWLPDFASEDEAAYAVELAHNWLGLGAANLQPEPSLYDDEAEEVRQRTREHLRSLGHAV